MSETVFPIFNAFDKSKQISQNLIQELRERFLERVAKNPNLYYSEDVDRVKINDWSISRYLIAYKTSPDVSKALERMDRAMKWRKEFGVRQLSDRDFPKEVYLSASVFIYGRDRNGTEILIGRSKVSKPMKSWKETAWKFTIYLYEKIDQRNGGKGLTLLSDCTDTSIMQTDMESTKFQNEVLNDYYPGLVDAIIIYNMPIILDYTFKIFRLLLNEEQNKYIYLCTEKNINDYVAVDQLPDFLSGTNTLSYRIVPPDAPTLHELAHRLGIKPEKANELAKHLEKFYKE